MREKRKREKMKEKRGKNEGEKKDESRLNKVDPEMENIPLREILLKLKVRQIDIKVLLA